MAPNPNPIIHSSSPEADQNVISRIYLIRHGDRFDYADPSWLDSARDHGALVTDPPLSALGHRQARETADELRRMIEKNDDGENNSLGSSSSRRVDKILVSPYLRVIQTASPASEALGVPLSIEAGLSESHATTGGGGLPTPAERFAYFPRVDPRHESLVDARPTPGCACPRTGLPCEAFAGEYCLRMGRMAARLEREFRGRDVVLFSHAASVALVSALLRVSMRGLKFAPCGIYRLERAGDGPWTMVRSGESNDGYVTENSPTTYPWELKEKCFVEGDDGKYSGSAEGIGVDYFVRNESKI